MLDTEGTPQGVAVNFTLNGQRVDLVVEPRETLASVLRARLGLTGTKIGCDAQVCGACTVLVDGAPMSSCTLFAFDIDGRSLLTIEGVASDGQLHPLQQAFIDRLGFQCGYCTSGMVMASLGLLEREPHPDRERVVEWLEGNICRCTGYEGIVSAVLDVAAQRRQAAAAARDGAAARDESRDGDGTGDRTEPNRRAGEAADEQADAYWDM